jgi:hypothetical protein
MRIQKDDVPPKTLEALERMAAGVPGVEVKGAKTPYTSLNGNMFSFITAERALALRLPAEVREALIRDGKARPCVQHGTMLKEYVVLSDKLLEDPRALKKLFAESHAYVASLKPKATTRKKKPPSRKA